MSAAAAEAAKYGKNVIVGIIKERAFLKAALEKAKANTRTLSRKISRAFEDRDINLNLIREQFISDQVNLQKAASEADSTARKTFAGSGVSGESREDISRDIERSVAKSRLDITRQRDQARDAELRSTQQFTEEAKVEAAGIGTEFKGSKTRAFLNRLGEGADYAATTLKRQEAQKQETQRRAGNLAIPKR